MISIGSFIGGWVYNLVGMVFPTITFVKYWGGGGGGGERSKDSCERDHWECTFLMAILGTGVLKQLPYSSILNPEPFFIRFWYEEKKQGAFNHHPGHVEA